MSLKLIPPETLVRIDVSDPPLFFLEGPVIGTSDWQSHAIEELQEQIGDCYVATSRKYDWSHPLSQFKVQGTDTLFDSKHSWKRHFASLAAHSGCLIFWLACEDGMMPKRHDAPYARETYVSLGEWLTHMQYNPRLQVVVGAEPNFPGICDIRNDFNRGLKTSLFPVHVTLKATIKAAVDKVRAARKVAIPKRPVGRPRNPQFVVVT